MDAMQLPHDALEKWTTSPDIKARFSRNELTIPRRWIYNLPGMHGPFSADDRMILREGMDYSSGYKWTNPGKQMKHFFFMRMKKILIGTACKINLIIWPATR